MRRTDAAALTVDSAHRIRNAALPRAQEKVRHLRAASGYFSFPMSADAIVFFWISFVPS